MSENNGEYLFSPDHPWRENVVFRGTPMKFNARMYNFFFIVLNCMAPSCSMPLGASTICADILLRQLNRSGTTLKR